MLFVTSFLECEFLAPGFDEAGELRGPRLQLTVIKLPTGPIEEPTSPDWTRRSNAAEGMPRWLSFTVFRDRCHRRAFLAAGLRPSATALADGATVHCWVPARPDPSRSPLLLLHGFGATAIWQWSPHLRPLLRAGFDLYVPDLLFFGVSATPGPDRSESYQAQCIMAAMEAAGVRRFGLVGVSYGGFVAYWMAAMYPTAVERVVLCCTGVCLEERDLAAGLFVVSDLREAIEILLPQRPEKLRQLVRLSFVRPQLVMPSVFLRDYIEVMCKDYVKEKTELIHAVFNERKHSDLPKINQIPQRMLFEWVKLISATWVNGMYQRKVITGKRPTLIFWGEQDQIFPLELGHRLQRHLGDNSQLAVISNAGHAVNLEKPKELCEHIIAFFLDSPHGSHNGQDVPSPNSQKNINFNQD